MASKIQHVHNWWCSLTAVLRIRIHVSLGLLDLDLDLLVKGMDQYPDPDLDPSNIKQK